MPTVSIVTVCFNSRSTLEKTIQSVSSQTYSNIEYIIIDGGSTDGTLEVIKAHAEIIAYWISERDEGISDAFNKGIMKATGDIVGIINADDWYTEDAVQQAVTTLLNNPKAGFCFADQEFVDLEGKFLYTQKGDPNYQEKIRYEMPSIPHPTVFVRKELYEKHGMFSKKYKTAMDYEFLLRLAVNGVTGKYIPSVMAYMRLGGTSDHKYRCGYREGMDASVAYGYSKWRALLRYLYKCSKTFIRKRIEYFGLYNVVRIFRTYIGKRYRY